MKRVLAMMIALLLLPQGPAFADDSDAGGLQQLLEERRKGKILPLFEILQRVNHVTGDDIAEIEFEREHGQVKYGIYYITPEGLRREIYVDAQTGEILEEKAVK